MSTVNMLLGSFPTTSSILGYSGAGSGATGPLGPTGPQGFGTGVEYYMYPSGSPFSLSRTPNGSETYYSGSAGAGPGGSKLMTFFTAAGDPNATLIPTGTFQFTVFAAAETTGTVQIYAKVIVTQANLDIVGEPVGQTRPSEVIVSTDQTDPDTLYLNLTISSPVVLEPTYRLAVEIWGVASAGTPTTYIVGGGPNHSSYVITPLSTPGPVGPTGPSGPTGATGPIAGLNTQIVYNNAGAPAGSSNLTFNNTYGTLSVSAATVSNNLSLSRVNGATYPQSLGNVGQSLTISSTTTTLYWTTPPSASYGNVIRVDPIYGNDTYGAIGTYPFLTVSAALGITTTGNTLWLLPGTHNLSAGITIPSGISLRGMNVQTTTLQMVDVTADTTLLTMGTNTRVEDLTLKLTSQEHHTLKGIVFGGTTTADAKLRTCVVTVNNASAGAAGGSTVTGVECSGTGTLGSASFSFNSLKGSTINVYSDGSGNKRGILVNNTNIVTTRDLNVYVAAPATPNTATGSYVGVETNDPANTGSIQVRSTTIGTVSPVGGNTYTSSDILQTTPATVTNPTYLAAAGIQIGPGTDLVTKSAGGKAFSTYVYPTTIFYCARGSVTATKTGYLWPGTQTFSNGAVPDETTPAARYRVQQPLIVSGLMASCAVGPGAGSNATVTVCKNAATGAAISGATAITVTLSGTAAETVKYYNTSVNFNTGDYISVYVNISGNALQDLAIQVDCF